MFIKIAFKELEKKVNKIKEKGDIAITYDGYKNIGLLFEQELGIEANDFSVPDINGIEIKVTKDTSSFPILLFSCTCDGPDFFELNRFVNRFGARNYEHKEIKVLYASLTATEFVNWGRYLKMKLSVDHKKRKIFILVANSNGKIIEKRAFWNFSTLEEILKRKLTYLCYVSYSTSFYNRKKFCRFNEAIYLKYRGFDKFIMLLEKGDIIVSINYGIYKTGARAGKACNHGTGFKIKKTAVRELFETFKF